VTGLGHRFRSDEAGTTVVEHAILICAIALVIVSLVGSGLSPRKIVQSFGYIADPAVADSDRASDALADPAFRGE